MTSNPYGEEAPLIDLAELPSWIVEDDADFLVLNKPGWVVCHPSKNGPLSSLVGAVREFTGMDTSHLVARLDRETSGLVLFARHRKSARLSQMAMGDRQVRKTYVVLLEGALAGPVDVDQPLAKALGSAVHVKQEVRRSNSAQEARTRFVPLASAGGFSLALAFPETGRKHQIRAHAAWLGHPVVGDKLYGHDETLYLEFIEKGWTPRLAAALPLPRQALHAYRLAFDAPLFKRTFVAPLPSDMVDFCRDRLGVDAVAAVAGSAE